jgi:hypothetical protein
MTEKRKSISWILKFTSNSLPDDEERIKCLQQNGNEAIRTVLKLVFDPNVEWLLPEGEPPYTPCEFPHQENMLYMEARRLYLFVKGGNDNLKTVRRERMYVDMLESIEPTDAKLLLAMKDKKLPKGYENITAKLVKKAFPDLF